jgi:hypothetical protein
MFCRTGKPITDNDCYQCGFPLEEEHVKYHYHLLAKHPRGPQQLCGNMKFHVMCWFTNGDEIKKDVEHYNKQFTEQHGAGPDPDEYQSHNHA